VAADLSSFVEGRRVDDNVNVLLRFSSGARGMLWACQVAPGNENALRLRVYGDKAGIDWHQEQPNHLRFARLGQPPDLITRSGPGAGPAAAHASRIPAGHPEGYLEGFAQIYSDVAEQIAARIEGREPDPACLLVPGVADGVRGVRFISAAVDSSRNNAAWTALSH
jgi:predicted dehydrogenase